MFKNKYVFWRFIAAACSITAILCFILCFFVIPERDRVIYLYLMIPVSLLMIYSLIHQMRFPLDLRIYVIWVLIFSCFTVSYGFSALGLFILYCSYILGTEIRFFSRGRIWKFSIAIVCFLIAAFYQIRLPLQEIINSIAQFIMMLIALVSMHFILKHLLSRINKEIFMEVQKDNLDEYFEVMNFPERDRVMLEEVLRGCKYEEIAINHNLSISSVKKRLAFLYKKLGVSCQIDFIIKFSKK